MIETYVFYVLYMICVLFSYAVIRRGHNWFFIISFTLLLGLRGCGIDYHGYLKTFDILINVKKGLFHPDYYDAIVDYSTQGFEWLYLVVIKIIKFFSLSSVVFFCFIAFLQSFFLDLFIKRFKRIKVKVLLAFFFFTSLLFVESFNVMRQLIAFFMFINIIPYLVKRDWKKYFLLTAFLYLVHSSSIILFPLYFFIHRDFLPNKYIQIGFYCFCVAFSLVFIEQLKDLFLMMYAALSFLELHAINYLEVDRADYMSQEITKSTGIGAVLFKLISLIFLVLNSEKFKRKYKSFGITLYNLTYLGFIIQEFIFGVGIQRASYYFYYIVFIVFALMCYDIIYTRRYRKQTIMIFYSFFILLLFFAWFSNSVLQGAVECAPYSFSKEFGS